MSVLNQIPSIDCDRNLLHMRRQLASAIGR